MEEVDRMALRFFREPGEIGTDSETAVDVGMAELLSNLHWETLCFNKSLCE